MNRHITLGLALFGGAALGATLTNAQTPPSGRPPPALLQRVEQRRCVLLHSATGPLCSIAQSNAPLAPSGTCRSIFAGGLWDRRSVLVPWAYRVQQTLVCA
jgi:hypothetical protein